MKGNVVTTSRMRELSYRVLNALIQGEGSSFSASFVSVTTKLPSEILNGVVDYLASKEALVVSRAQDSRPTRKGLSFSSVEITQQGRKLYALMAERRTMYVEAMELSPV